VIYQAFLFVLAFHVEFIIYYVRIISFSSKDESLFMILLFYHVDMFKHVFIRLLEALVNVLYVTGRSSRSLMHFGTQFHYIWSND
jgi:hypothetical protein